MSATFPLQVALEATLTGDVTLAAMLVGDGVFARRAPDGTPLNAAGGRVGYIVLGSSSEDDSGDFGRVSASHFGRDGTSNRETLHIWSDNIADAKAIYAEVERLLDRTRLTLDGHTMVHGRLSYLTDLTDPDGAAVQIIARYRAWALEGAA